MRLGRTTLFAIFGALACVPREEPGTPAASCAPPAALEPIDDAAREPVGCEARTRYPVGATHSPITCSVAASLRQIVERAPRREGVFLKVGDSISATHEFLHCFETSDPRLSAQGHPELEEAHRRFLRERVGRTTSYARVSLAAEASRTAEWALREPRPPVEQELAETHGRYAFVMYGTNDIGYGGRDAAEEVKLAWMLEHMTALLDWLSARGVVPILSSIPPYTGEVKTEAHLVPVWNAILRALAEARQIPFIDYHREMLALPNAGLRGDGTHPSSDYRWLCDFSAETGLIWGYNLRNLLSLRALDRAWRVTRSASPFEALDERGAPPLPGRGAREAPFVVLDLPFAEVRRGRGTAPAEACDAPGALTYRIDLASPRALRVLALTPGDPAPRLLWLTSRGACAPRGTLVRGTFAAGSHAFAALAREEEEVVFVVVPCEEDDERCAGGPLVSGASPSR